MAVYTHVDQSDCRQLCLDVGIGALCALEPIEQGIENTNYYLATDQGRFILTLFEKRTDKASLPFVFSLQDHLRSRGLPCPSCLYQAELAGRPCAVLSFLSGGSVNDITAESASKAGKTLAQLHINASGFPMRRVNPMGYDALMTLFVRNAVFMDGETAARMQDILANPCDPACPTGPIHADFFPDNVFFDSGGDVCGVIDFYFACTDYLLYDLALAMHAWRYGNAFLAGYQSVRPLSLPERSCLPDMLRRAAARIFLTRLHDWHTTPEGAIVTRKDPEEYRVLMMAGYEEIALS